VSYCREQIADCLDYISNAFGVPARELHFVDIYNRNPPWDKLPDRANLGIFEAFASIYKQYRWPVFIQTIDDRTFRDHRIEGFSGKIEGLNLSDRNDISLLWLLLKLKTKHKAMPEPLTLYVDEGRKKAGISFGHQIFYDWPCKFMGQFASSAKEPLLQIADFIAFCLNRSTHLEMKDARTEIDNWFLNMVGHMGINSEDCQLRVVRTDFDVKDFKPHPGFSWVPPRCCGY
jgi:hypothetical protein